MAWYNVRFIHWLWNGGTPVEAEQPLTDAQLRAAPPEVDTGLVQPTTPADTQPVSGAVSADKGAGWTDPQTDALTDAELRAAPVPVQDDLSGGNEHLPDAPGADSVEDFELSDDGAMVIVDVDNLSAEDTAVYRARATVDGTIPSATVGFVCRSGGSTYIPTPTTGGVVKVYLPSGTVGSVQVLRR